jgi:signal transduction histidine kinase
MSPNRESLGVGLQLMRYRAGLVGGTLHIGSTGERGTEVSCTIVHPAR